MDVQRLSRAASARIESLTSDFQNRLRAAVRELAQHVPDMTVVGSELVDLAAAKVWAESISELKCDVIDGESPGGRDAA